MRLNFVTVFDFPHSKSKDNKAFSKLVLFPVVSDVKTEPQQSMFVVLVSKR